MEGNSASQFGRLVEGGEKFNPPSPSPRPEDRLRHCSTSSDSSLIAAKERRKESFAFCALRSRSFIQFHETHKAAGSLRSILKSSDLH